MEEKRSEFVDAVEDQRIVPEEDCDAERSEREREVGVEPREVVGKEEGLRHARDVDHVAKVEHEELVRNVDKLWFQMNFLADVMANTVCPRLRELSPRAKATRRWDHAS